MAQTPTGTATPYCSALELFAFHDRNQCADLLRDGDGPRPSPLEMLDGTSTAGGLLVTLLLAASGEFESACLVGKRYSPDDLAALTGSGAQRLKKLVGDLAFWTLTQRRQPGTADPKKVPGAETALEALKQLKDGEYILGLVESAAAGLPGTSDPQPTDRPDSLVNEAGRFFGTGGGGSTRRGWC